MRPIIIRLAENYRNINLRSPIRHIAQLRQPYKWTIDQIFTAQEAGQPRQEQSENISFFAVLPEHPKRSLRLSVSSRWKTEADKHRHFDCLESIHLPGRVSWYSTRVA